MKEPKIAAKHPSMESLGAGTYFWCACGRSSNQPFCDGSHKGTGHSPVQFKIDKEQDVWLCQCKHSGNKPFCDGSHKDL